jgi:hypothetical protein
MNPRTLSFLIALFSVVVTVPPCTGEDRDPYAGVSDVPRLFKVYNSDTTPTVVIGAQCSHVADNKVTCHFQYVKFGGQDPDEPDPQKMIAEEMKKDPQKARDEIEKNAKEMCSPSSKEEIETTLRNPELGPKRKRVLQQMLEACSAKDPTQAFLASLSSLHACQLAVVGYAIDFERVQKGLWVSGPGPQGVCSRAILSTLKQVKGLWTLTETLSDTTPTSGALWVCDAGITPEGKEIRTITFSRWWHPVEPPASCDFFDPLLMPE